MSAGYRGPTTPFWGVCPALQGVKTEEELTGMKAFPVYLGPVLEEVGYGQLFVPDDLAVRPSCIPHDP